MTQEDGYCECWLCCSSVDALQVIVMGMGVNVVQWLCYLQQGQKPVCAATLQISNIRSPQRHSTFQKIRDVKVRGRHRLRLLPTPALSISLLALMTDFTSPVF